MPISLTNNQLENIMRHANSCAGCGKFIFMIVEMISGDNSAAIHLEGRHTCRALEGRVQPRKSLAARTILHKTTRPDQRAIVDAVREVRPPFSPSAVVDDFATLIKSYRVSKVVGGDEFVKEPFRRHGINYEVCKQPKSDLFRDMLLLLNAGHITLPGSSLRSSAWSGGCRALAEIASITRRALTMILRMQLRVLPR